MDAKRKNDEWNAIQLRFSFNYNFLTFNPGEESIFLKVQKEFHSRNQFSFQKGFRTIGLLAMDSTIFRKVRDDWKTKK